MLLIIGENTSTKWFKTLLTDGHENITVDQYGYNRFETFYINDTIVINGCLSRKEATKEKSWIKINSENFKLCFNETTKVLASNLTINQMANYDFTNETLINKINEKSLISVQGTVCNVTVSTLSTGITRTACVLINTVNQKSIDCEFYELVEPLINNANYQFNNIIISKNPGLKLSHSKWASELVYLSSNDSIISTAVKSLTINSYNKSITKINSWQEFHSNTTSIFGTLKGIN